MPSFRCKIKKLRFQGILTDKETNRILDALDKADKAENTAEWIDHSEDDLKISDYRCSKCGYWMDDKTKYCQNCGAKMKEGDKE